MTRALSDTGLIQPFDQSTIGTFQNLAQRLLTESPDDFLRSLPKTVCELLSAPVCIFWRANLDASKLVVFSTYGDVDSDYQSLEIDLGHPSIKSLFAKNTVLSLPDINDAPVRIAELDALNQRKWISLLSVPLILNQQPVGMLDIFTKKTRDFQVWEKNILRAVGNHAVLAWRTADLLQDRDSVHEDRESLQNLTDIMTQMTAASDADEIWRLLELGAYELVKSASYVSIAKLTQINGNGQLESVKPFEVSKIRLKRGITSKSLQDEKAIIANDVFSEQWKDIYVSRREDTRAEMSIPLLVDKVLIRQGSTVKTGSKRIGVLNIESSVAGSFDKTHKSRLSLVAQHTALRIEKLDFHRKLLGIREVEKEVSQEQNYKKIIKTVVKGIAEILNYSWVNISLIDADRTKIRSEFIFGLSKEQTVKFKEMCVHSLDSNDIQARIVDARKIEVLSDNDPRLDEKIFKQFGHQDLCRVFIPMIEPSSNLVIGTVEAGYKRSFRPHIYEKDIQLLQGFVDYAVNALERKKSIIIDRISHEINSPIVGIKSHASFIQRRFSDVRVSSSTIAIKCEDILTDCDLLLYQTRQIAYFLGKSLSEKPCLEPVIILRDVVIKTVNQLKPVLSEHGFPSKGITWWFGEAARLTLNTDRVMLNQVVYNLLMNAIKYADKDASAFKILIEADYGRDVCVIKFKDWGIGIKEEYADKIFKEGFRTPAAINKDSGIGLGLSISGAIMKRLGGSLRLVNHHKPTEFHVTLPIIK